MDKVKIKMDLEFETDMIMRYYIPITLKRKLKKTFEEHFSDTKFDLDINCKKGCFDKNQGRN